MISYTFDLTIINPWVNGLIILLSVVIIIVLLCAISILSTINRLKSNAPHQSERAESRFKHYINTMNSKQISDFITVNERKRSSKSESGILSCVSVIALSLISNLVHAQGDTNATDNELMSNAGVLITL